MKHVAILILLLVPPFSVNALTIHVPAEHATIQAALDFAQTGDTVLVAPGTYSGDGNWDLSFGGKELALLGSGGQVRI
ncbi:MAG: hypothetical protein GY835_13710 [bacterium]|nr:hypothetical protein [bacterium]